MRSFQEVMLKTGDISDPPFNGGDYIHNHLSDRIRRFWWSQTDLFRQWLNFAEWGGASDLGFGWSRLSSIVGAAKTKLRALFRR